MNTQQFKDVKYLTTFNTEFFEVVLELKGNKFWVSAGRGHWIMVIDMNTDLEVDDPCRIPLIYIRDASKDEAANLDSEWYADMDKFDPFY